jgi:copper homeostasis protein
MVLVEVCADSVASVVAAHAGGARRIELCSGLVDGGVTPSVGMVSTVCKVAAGLLPPMPIMVLIRARGGDFVFTEDEVSIMVCDIEAVAAAGAAGVVVGALSANGEIDLPVAHRLIAAARKYGLLVTFHRAIDMTPDPLAAFVRYLKDSTGFCSSSCHQCISDWIS